MIRDSLAEYFLRDATRRDMTPRAMALFVAGDVRSLAQHLVTEQARLEAEPASPARDRALAAIHDLGSLGVVHLQASELPGAPPWAFPTLADAVATNVGRLLTALDAARAAGE